MNAQVEMKHALDTGLLTPENDLRTQRIAKNYFYSSVIFIMCSAALVAPLPNAWFDSAILSSLGQWGRFFWPKLEHDAAILDSRALGRGGKYVVFVLYCAWVLAASWIVIIPTIARSLLRGMARPLTYPESSVWWKALFGIPILTFFIAFDKGLIGSDTYVGRMITNSWGLWFWTALLWWMLFMALATLTIFAIRRWKYGLPENKWDYRSLRPWAWDISPSTIYSEFSTGTIPTRGNCNGRIGRFNLPQMQGLGTTAEKMCATLLQLGRRIYLENFGDGALKMREAQKRRHAVAGLHLKLVR